MPKRHGSGFNQKGHLGLLGVSIAFVMTWSVWVGPAGAADNNDSATANRALVGTQLTYRVHYKSEGYTERPATQVASSGGETPTRHNLLGTLEGVEILTFLSHDHTGYQASVRFEKVAVNIQVRFKVTAGQERISGRTSNTLRLSILIPSIESHASKFPRNTPAMASNFIKAIVTLQQYAVPSSSEIRKHPRGT